MNKTDWKYKACRYKKVIIKKSQYRILPNGDIEIMARESEIGFKTRKKTTGGSNKPTNRELLLKLQKDLSDFTNWTKNEFTKLRKDNNLK